jgi:hypothetical protein
MAGRNMTSVEYDVIGATWEDRALRKPRSAAWDAGGTIANPFWFGVDNLVGVAGDVVDIVRGPPEPPEIPDYTSTMLLGGAAILATIILTVGLTRKGK